jgi:hypothetical protein
VGFAEPSHGLGELPGLAEIGHERPVSHACTRARYAQLVRFSFLILIGRFVTLEWVARDDGHGFEIKGISGEMMRVFSTRRESITADLRVRAARFEAQ